MQNAMRPMSAIALVIALLIGLVSPLGSGRVLASDDQDHERARRALEAGEVMPLRGLIDVVEREHPGEIVEIELERDDGRWIYEIKQLRRDGSMSKLKVDARDGRVLSIRGRDADGRRTDERVR